MDDLVIEGKTYLSSKRAAEITGYAKDYVGQLCREGRVEARLVGRSWYVLEQSIREHRFGKQEEEVVHVEPTVEEPKEQVSITEDLGSWSSPKYSTEEVAPLPQLRPKMVIERPLNLLAREIPSDISNVQAVKVEEQESRLPEQVSVEENVTDQELLESEVEVTIHKVPEVQKIAIQAPQPPVAPHITQQTRRKRAPKAVKRGSNLIYTSIIIGTAVIALVIILIGTGYIDQTPFEGKNESIIDYLGGKSFYSK